MMQSQKFKNTIRMSGIFIVASLLFGCSGGGNNAQGVESNAPATNKPTQAASPVASPNVSPNASPSLAPVPKAENKSSMEQMLAFFPKDMNMEWRYSDGQLYGHKMRDTQIQDVQAGKILKIIGLFKDSVLNGKGKTFDLEYGFTSEGIIEKVASAESIFPHTIKTMIIIKGPLEKNNYWEQEVIFPGNADKVKLEAKIQDILTEGNRKVYKIRYAASVSGYPQNVYREERHYKEGQGLVHYAHIEKSGKLFSYSLEKLDFYVSPNKP